MQFYSLTIVIKMPQIIASRLGISTYGWLRKVNLFLCRLISGAGIAQSYRDSLGAGRYGDRIPVGARFPAPVQTGSEAQPASYTKGTGSFPGVKRPGRGVDHPLPSSAEVTGRVELYLYSPSETSWPVLG